MKILTLAAAIFIAFIIPVCAQKRTNDPALTQVTIKQMTNRPVVEALDSIFRQAKASCILSKKLEATLTIPAQTRALGELVDIICQTSQPQLGYLRDKTGVYRFGLKDEVDQIKTAIENQRSRTEMHLSFLEGQTASDKENKDHLTPALGLYPVMAKRDKTQRVAMVGLHSSWDREEAGKKFQSSKRASKIKILPQTEK